MKIDDKHVLVAKFELLNTQRNWKTLALFCLKEANGVEEDGKKLYKNILKYYPKRKITSYNFLWGLHFKINKKAPKSKIISMLTNSRTLWM